MTLATLLIFRFSHPPTLAIYPAPGDLTAAEGLRESQAFDVTINGQWVFINDIAGDNTTYFGDDASLTKP